jgi:hypothetical protein
MKAATKHTSPVIIPIKGKDIQKVSRGSGNVPKCNLGTRKAW